MLQSRALAAAAYGEKEFLLHIPAGQTISQAIQTQLRDAEHIRFALLSFQPGYLESGVCHTAPPDSAGKFIVKYGAGHEFGPCLLLAGDAVLGEDQYGAPLVHCHGCLVEQSTQISFGGHLDLSRCIVGKQGLSVQVLVTADIGFVAKKDSTSQMHVFHPSIVSAEARL
ncbi:hypothetical protein [Paenalcaligenes suwonensis]|uniref:hypothetical protein n=1 Tax=Paenalcaligenes suwonensis TaxID=1202713 RepID=UPI00140C6234|nr:hypothetical protein [Paenalcaligenes suwonensis]NHC62071.1 hypothetical protein [Paenalcaligenes suwonensis]